MPSPTETRALPDVAALRDRLVTAEPWLLAAILGVAAVLRFVSLETRGRFDLDQGRDMLVLRDFVVGGVVPLLGPPASSGAGHHGALYYHLLAPAALTNGAVDPFPVVALIAIGGCMAVLATWWLARELGGAIAGLIGALLLATSATAIEASTVIWNPSLLPVAGGVAFAGAVTGWRRGGARWWLVAGAGASATTQLHLLGGLILPPLAVLWLVALRRAGRSAGEHSPGTGSRGVGDAPDGTASFRTVGGAEADRRRHLLAGCGAVMLVAGGFLPLLVNELGSGFAEVRGILDQLGHGTAPTPLDPPARVIVASIRTLGWPLAGSLATAPATVVGMALAILGAIVARLVLGRGDERWLVAWLAGTILWTVIVLGLVVPSASVVTPLPTDHYHAWLDPAITAIAALGIARLVGRAARRPAARRPSVAPLAPVALAALGGVVGWNLAIAPPARSPDGDWTAVRSTAARFVALAAGRPIGFVTLPPFKGPAAYEYAVKVAGASTGPATDADVVVVICEALWVPDCGGEAEARALGALGTGGASASLRVVERSIPVRGRTVTVLERAPAAQARPIPAP